MDNSIRQNENIRYLPAIINQPNKVQQQPTQQEVQYTEDIMPYDPNEYIGRSIVKQRITQESILNCVENKEDKQHLLGIVNNNGKNPENKLTVEQTKFLLNLYNVNQNLNSGLMNEETNKLIRNLKPENYEKAIENAKIFSNVEILNILGKTYDGTIDNIKFMTEDSFKSELLQNSAGKYQQELLEMLIPEKLKTSTFNSLTNKELSKEDFLNSVKKLSKSTFKLAYDRPNQYLSNIKLEYSTPINGKYPELPKEELRVEKWKIKSFFKNNMGQLCRVLKYIDTDTVNHFMDRRTELFAESLTELDQLTDDNFELLSKLLTCKSQANGKPLSPKEKMQVCKMVVIYQLAAINMDKLKESAEKGEIDLKAAKQIVQDEVLKEAGIDINNPEQIKNNNKINEEFSYLTLLYSKAAMEAQIESLKPQYCNLLNVLRNDSEFREMHIEQLTEMCNDNRDMLTDEAYQLNMTFIDMLKNIDKYTDEEFTDIFMKSAKLCIKNNQYMNNLNTCIRESIQGNFKEFIENPSNPFGETNLKTKEIFEQEGLDYDKWISPQIDDINLEVANKKMSIKMWDRNPQEDLFIGNKTTCCTAIGTGVNAAATPIYLLNTAFNVVELYDDKGNVVGMSRVFMGKIDDMPSLIMDNIELNKTYVKGMTNEQKKEIRNGFFDYMNKYAQQITNDKNSQVYFFSGDIHVPSDDLEHVHKVTDFIGELSQEAVYVNAACKWIKASELPKKGKIDWLVVPKQKVE